MAWLPPGARGQGVVVLTGEALRRRGLGDGALSFSPVRLFAAGAFCFRFAKVMECALLCFEQAMQPKHLTGTGHRAPARLSSITTLCPMAFSTHRECCLELLKDRGDRGFCHCCRPPSRVWRDRRHSCMNSRAKSDADKH